MFSSSRFYLIFSSGPMVKALLNAHEKGVRVEVILDKSQSTERRRVIRTFGRAKYMFFEERTVLKFFLGD